MLKSLISRTAVLSLQRTSLIPELSFKNGSYKSHGLQANDGISVSPADQNSFSQEGACSRDNRRVGRAIGRSSRQSAIGHTGIGHTGIGHTAIGNLVIPAVFVLSPIVAVNKELEIKTRKAIQRGVVVFIEVLGLQPCAINNIFLS